jgi:leucyl-tRNA synthetase
MRLARDVASPPGTDVATGDLALRQVTHRTVHEVTHAVETFRFNVAVARVMELVNAARKAIDSGAGPADPAVREAAETVAILLSLVTPYTAEEMWEQLGHPPTIALVPWPEADPSLLVRDSVTCVVQVAGKLRDRLEVSPDIDEAQLQSLALASEAVQRALEGRGIRTVVVRAPRLVNVVPD